MADVAKNPSLAEDYFLKGKEVAETAIKAVEGAPASAAAEEVVPEKTEETPAVVESSEAPAAAVEASSEASDAAVEASSEASDAAVEASSEVLDAAVESTETAPAAEPAAEEDSGSAESETAGDEAAAEGTREIKLETAPADFRFPTTNQTRHCFTRYVEYHRCIAAKGDDAPECQKFAKYYRALCPGEWVDRWNEQRENGTFPGPL